MADKQPRTYRRTVMARRGTRAHAEEIAGLLAAGNPEGEYAVEYTPVCTQLEQWRVIKISDVPDGTPDQHPRCHEIRQQQRGQIRDMYDHDRGWL